MARKTDVVALEYQGTTFNFSEDAWCNATKAAEPFGRKPAYWLELDSTKDYLAALLEFLNVGKSDIIKTKRGKNGGTWFHPRLAVPFARWLDVRFSIWCDIQIDSIIRGTHPHYDWRKARHEAAASYKLLAESLKLHRSAQDKATKAYHFTNEAKLINWCIKGQFKGLDRNTLTLNELDLLAKLEVRNAVLIGQGHSYNDRKIALSGFTAEFRANHTHKLEAVA